MTLPTWAFKDHSYFSFVDEALITGSGALTPFTSLEGIAAVGSTKTPLSLQYGASNALAATTAELHGFWVDKSVTFIVRPDGTFTASTTGSVLGRCTIAGTMNNKEGTSENLFAMKLTAQGDATCQLRSNDPYSGYASIGFKPAGWFVSQGYYRILQFLVKTEAGAFFSGGPEKL
ncbi:MAG: hypothetical protein JWQ11_16 [Rhizobacter sp.]|nr:hypothetical protein [Rhizobacter sp.]